MSTLCIETRGPCNWRERLASPGTQWKRKASAYETAVSWEKAACVEKGLPPSLSELFKGTVFDEPRLLLAIAEHKVPLLGGNADSQCDVWAIVQTSAGMVSMSVEAKANEPFGKGNQTLKQWREEATSEQSVKNRQERWKHIVENLPACIEDGYSCVPYQLLHRCAAAVLEARRFQLTNAAFIVQAFNSPSQSFDCFGRFCGAAGVCAERGRLNFTTVGKVRLGIGWADCPFVTDEDIASVM